MSPFLRVDKAQMQTAQINYSRQAAYRHIKKQCQEAIRNAINNNCTSVCFLVPVILPGHGLYAAADIARHLGVLLQQRGYSVKMLAPLYIRIEWRKQGERLPKIKKPATQTSSTLLKNLQSHNALRGI